MKKGGGSASTIIIGPSKSVLAPQVRIRPRPCPISGVRAKIIIINRLSKKLYGIFIEFSIVYNYNWLQ